MGSRKTHTSAALLDRLAEKIASRLGDENASSSYVRELAQGGKPLAARKLGEEAVEVAVAALAEPEGALIRESADLLFHWLVLLALCGVRPEAVYAELARRMEENP